MKKSDISKYFSELAKKRHAKLTKKQRSEMGRKMAEARWGKTDEGYQLFRAKALSVAHAPLKEKDIRKAYEKNILSQM